MLTDDQIKIVKQMRALCDTLLGQEAAPKLGLIVPAYWEPETVEGQARWQLLIDAAPKVPMIVIINPDSGPGVGTQPAYASVIARAAAAGILVIGYVSTAEGTRPPAEVRADVLRWWQQYPGASGIFFDQMPTVDEPFYVARYAGFVADARSLFPGRFVAVNPGAPCARSYYAVARPNVIVMRENAGVTMQIPEWAVAEPDAAFAGLCHASDELTMRAVVGNARTLGLGWIYVTPDRLPNPWDTLPPYFLAEVEKVRTA